MDQTLQQGIKMFTSGKPLPPLDSLSLPNDETAVVDVTVTTEGETSTVEMSVVTGSTSWMQFNKRMIREYTEATSAYNWQIIEPCRGQTWPTSDHPVIRFERRDEIYIHGTGWLREGTEIFFPLTPRFALYTAVGTTTNRPPVATRLETWDFVRLLIGHADRSIFADRRGYKWIEWESRRRVDL